MSCKTAATLADRPRASANPEPRRPPKSGDTGQWSILRGMKTPAGSRSPYLASRLQGLGTTVFAEMSALAERTGSINLGQGFPDRDGPAEVAEAAIAAIRAGRNQYPPGPGIAELREAIAGHQRRFYGIDLDPDREVLVTAGATEAITAALLGLCEVGDEVVVFEPFYDSYGAAIAMAGAQRRVVPLEPPDWSFDPERLAAAVTPRTRLDPAQQPAQPHRQGLHAAGAGAGRRCCVEHDLLAVTDEVYEHLVFEGRHVPLCTLPGMADRTVTVSSAGKTFAFTGWKVGWACGPAAAGRRGAHRQAVPDLRQRGALPAGGGGRPGLARRLLRGRGPGAASRGGTGCVRAWRRPGSRCSNRTPPISPSPAWPGLASPTGCRSAGPAGALRGGGGAGRARSTTTPVSPGPWCASPSASSRTCSTRPCAGWPVRPASRCAGWARSRSGSA